MPAIDPRILDTVVYLYPDTESAKSGERAGGSACLVAIPVPANPLFAFAYVVTNSHVIDEGRCAVIRVNTRDGRMGIIHSTEKGWIHHPDGDDVAVLPISLEYDEIKSQGIPLDMFATKEKIEEYRVGPGDEVFMVGRFINHEGRERNLPTVRFGNLAMLPYEKVRHPRGMLQEAFLVECRSLPGYSGSPVFLHPLPFSSFPRKSPPPMFLGIDVGAIKDARQVLDRNEFMLGKRIAVNPNWMVEANTGMAYIVPAWKIQQLLNVEVLVEARNKHLAELEEAKNKSSLALDVAVSEEPPFTQADFQSALTQVSRRVAPSQSGKEKK